MYSKSKELFNKSSKLFPGGVNSPVRAFKSVGSSPIFFKKSQGAYLYDVDGNEYIDYVGSWGPMICGHGHSKVIEAIQQVAEKGISFGACHEYEIHLAEIITKLMPNIEMLRFVNSGTEACMAVARLARAYTKRPKILKFNGCYHGHFDSFLVQAGSGVATMSLPDSPGVPSELAELTLTANYNNLEEVEKCFEQNPNSIAAIMVEPVVGNSGCLLPQNGFLEGLRNICNKYGALLIFDEVMTGFRVAKGGAQERFNVSPDLTTLGKIVGGGLPVGAYGGKKEIMEMIAPSGPVYQAGTLSGNPLGMVAGATTLNLIQEEGFYENLELYGEKLETGIKQIMIDKEVPVTINRCGAMLSVFFTDQKEVYNFPTAKTSDTNRFAKFFNELLKNGIYLPPSQFEAWFFSSIHSKNEIEKTLNAIEAAQF
ncbi:MAG: glutamate-1-semialdehyde 2,1-aminomutase [Candidatus Caenarcaniphilales bacterium]|nr:glutamate-1-semialdehyde 2,1-aminomutase [Candidatus Caenarcaniphilales bacterium]